MWVCWAALALAGEGELSVDVIDGGLMQAAHILVARHGVPIHYEMVPYDIEGIHFRVDREDGEIIRRRIVAHGLKFTYPSTSTPREALEAAVRAANARPDAEAIYTIREEQGHFDLVPVQRRTLDGFVPYTPLMDTVVTLPSATGTPTDLYRAFLPALSAAAGVPVREALEWQALSPEKAPAITLPSATGPARTLLGQIVAASEYVTEWRLIWIPDDDYAHGWNMMLDMSQPEHDAMLNRTPLPQGVRTAPPPP